jgi:hypothetical protein
MRDPSMTPERKAFKIVLGHSRSPFTPQAFDRSKSYPLVPTDPNADDCGVRPDDLKDIPKIQSLLLALNDPYASIVKLVGSVRVLDARCRRRARLKALAKEVTSLDHALAIIGNKGTEEELFGVLEDLTVLKAELGR